MKLLGFAIAFSLFAARGLAGEVEAPLKKFTPSANPSAHRLVTEQFTLVDDLKKIDPEVLAVFYTKVQPEYIAGRDERFNSTDVVTENLPARRFIVAGSTPGLWFIFYEHGGIACHHNLVVFSKNEHWQIVAGAGGNDKG